MIAISERLRVHLFLSFDPQITQECITRNLLGEQRLRGKIAPRNMTDFSRGDYAILWCRQSNAIRGIWIVEESGENLEVNAFGGRLPLQVRVSLCSKQVINKSYASIEPLLSKFGKKEDFYDGTRAQDILNAFGVSIALGDGCSIDISAASAQPSKYRPPFFDEMLQTSEWWGFEDYTHALLRMLGIHNLHPIPRDNQAGRPDGVFTIGGLAVIYDATLNSKSETDKQQQVRNYINDLKGGDLKIPPNHTEPIAHCTKKRVWLLVRGRSGVDKTEGSIKVCYVDVQHLMALSEKRLVSAVSLEDLEDELARMGTA